MDSKRYTLPLTLTAKGAIVFCLLIGAATLLYAYVSGNALRAWGSILASVFFFLSCCTRWGSVCLYARLARCVVGQTDQAFARVVRQFFASGNGLLSGVFFSVLNLASLRRIKFMFGLLTMTCCITLLANVHG